MSGRWRWRNSPRRLKRFASRRCTRTPQGASRFSQVRVEALEERALLAIVGWDGGGDGESWNDPLNWSNDLLPGADDDVTIDVEGELTVKFCADDEDAPTIIRSLTLAESLSVSDGVLQTTDFSRIESSGYLRVHNGGSVNLANGVHAGNFRVAGGASLVFSGDAQSFTETSRIYGEGDVTFSTSQQTIFEGQYDVSGATTSDGAGGIDFRGSSETAGQSIKIRNGHVDLHDYDVGFESITISDNGSLTAGDVYTRLLMLGDGATLNAETVRVYGGSSENGGGEGTSFAARSFGEIEEAPSEGWSGEITLNVERLINYGTIATSETTPAVLHFGDDAGFENYGTLNLYNIDVFGSTARIINGYFATVRHLGFGVSIIRPAFFNDGFLEVIAGSLQLHGSNETREANGGYGQGGAGGVGTALQLLRDNDGEGIATVAKSPVDKSDLAKVRIPPGQQPSETGATHWGDFRVAEGGALHFIGERHVFSWTSEISGAGNVLFATSLHSVFGGQYNISGESSSRGAGGVDFKGFTLNSGQRISIQNGPVNLRSYSGFFKSITIADNGSLTAGDITTQSLTLNNGAILNADTVRVLDGGADQEWSGDVTLNVGRLKNEGTIATSADGLTTLHLGETTVLENFGTLDLNFVDIFGASAQIVNRAGGIIRFNGDGVSTIRPAFFNDGILEVAAGALQLHGANGQRKDTGAQEPEEAEEEVIVVLQLLDDATTSTSIGLLPLDPVGEPVETPPVEIPPERQPISDEPEHLGDFNVSAGASLQFLGDRHAFGSTAQLHVTGAATFTSSVDFAPGSLVNGSGTITFAGPDVAIRGDYSLTGATILQTGGPISLEGNILAVGQLRIETTTARFGADLFEFDDASNPNDRHGLLYGSPVLVNGALRLGAATISQANEIDRYQFTIDAIRDVSLQTFAQRIGSALDTRLTLRDATGAVIATSNDYIGTDSRIVSRLAPGTYVVEVSSVGATTGAYQLDLGAFATAAASPRVLRMFPGGTTIGPQGASLPVRILLDNTRVDPATITLEALEVFVFGPDGAPLEGVTARLRLPSAPGMFFNAAKNEINVVLEVIDNSTNEPLAALPSARYQIRPRTSGAGIIRNLADGAPIAPFEGLGSMFAIDAIAPEGTLAVDRANGADASGILFAFRGTVRDLAPATSGGIVKVELDVDGNLDFRDAVPLHVTLAEPETDTLFTIMATKGIAIGNPAATVRVRLTDALGNSRIVSTTVNTDLPLVTSARRQGDEVVVSFSDPISDLLPGALDAANYQIAGQTVTSVELDSTDVTGRSVRLITSEPLADGIYDLTVSGDIATLSGEAIDGDGDGVAGGDHHARVLFDRAAPVFGGVTLADDTGVTGDNITSIALPKLTISISDFFPGGALDSGLAANRITVAIDSDNNGLFDDGQAVLQLAAAGDAQTATIALTSPLANGENTLRIRATDLAGNSTETSFTVILDRNGPSLLNSPAPSAETGKLEFVFAFSEELNFDINRLLAGLRLIASAGLNGDASDGRFLDGNERDRTEFISAADISYTPGSADSPPELRVLARFPNGAADWEDYQLVIDEESLTDVAGNVLVGGSVYARAEYNGGPQVTRVFIAAPLGDQDGLDLIVVQFDGYDLNRASAESPNNYLLEYIDETGAATPVVLDAPRLLPIGSRVVLRRAIVQNDFPAFDSGRYRLTVRDIIGATGRVSLTPFEEEFTITPDGGVENNDTPEAKVSDRDPGGGALDPDLFAAATAGLDSLLAARLELDALNSRALVGRAFAEGLLSLVEINLAAGASSSEINDSLLAAFNAQRTAAGFGNGEYLIAWASDQRMLVLDSTDDPSLAAGSRTYIGRQIDGELVTDRIPGAMLVERSFGLNGLPQLSLVVVPIRSASFVAEESLQSPDDKGRVTINDAAPVADLDYAIEVEGLLKANQGGFVAAGQRSQSRSGVTDGAPVGEVELIPIENLGSAVTGLDPAGIVFTDQILAELAAFFNVASLSDLDETFLILALDPVDYTLTGPSGAQATNGSGAGVTTFANAFAGKNGVTELVVVRGAERGQYTLELGGLGGKVRGSSTLVSGGEVTTSRFQVDLQQGEQLVAQLDYNASAPNGGVGGGTSGGGTSGGGTSGGGTSGGGTSGGGTSGGGTSGGGTSGSGTSSGGTGSGGTSGGGTGGGGTSGGGTSGGGTSGGGTSGGGTSGGGTSGGDNSSSGNASGNSNSGVSDGASGNSNSSTGDNSSNTSNGNQAAAAANSGAGNSDAAAGDSANSGQPASGRSSQNGTSPQTTTVSFTTTTLLQSSGSGSVSAPFAVPSVGTTRLAIDSATVGIPRGLKSVAITNADGVTTIEFEFDAEATPERLESGAVKIMTGGADEKLETTEDNEEIDLSEQGSPERDSTTGKLRIKLKKALRGGKYQIKFDAPRDRTAKVTETPAAPAKAAAKSSSATSTEAKDQQTSTVPDTSYNRESAALDASLLESIAPAFDAYESDSLETPPPVEAADAVFEQEARRGEENATSAILDMNFWMLPAAALTLNAATAEKRQKQDRKKTRSRRET